MLDVGFIKDLNVLHFCVILDGHNDRMKLWFAASLFFQCSHKVYWKQ